jgi:hypothetical protein
MAAVTKNRTYGKIAGFGVITQKRHYSDFNLSSLCSSFLMLLSSEAEHINCVAFGLVRACC